MYLDPEYVQEYMIDDGESMFDQSLFYAKLYLSLLLFKIITILTKSNDQRVYYIKNAGLNKNMSDRLQQVAREIKEKQNIVDCFIVLIDARVPLS